MTLAETQDGKAMRSRERPLARESQNARERKCIVTGESAPVEKLMRYVVGPGDEVVPDVAARLPGRGIWITATRAAVERARAKNLFARAAKGRAIAAPDLADRTERALLARISGDLGLARASRALVFGFDNVARAFDAGRPPALLVEASDGARDGRRKLLAAAHARGTAPWVVACMTGAELSLALGRENVIHAAVLPGGFAERLRADTERLKGFRADPAVSDERD